MRNLKPILVAALLVSFGTAPLTALAADQKVDQKTEKNDQKVKPKPYTLKTCPVSGDKLGGDMGDPYAFVYKDREIKLCCKGCLKDFQKTPAKFIKKIEQAEAKEKKKEKS